jgi:hypothetical protein
MPAGASSTAALSKPLFNEPSRKLPATPATQIAMHPPEKVSAKFISVDGGKVNQTGPFEFLNF